jgi:hypothetical protein
VLSWGNLVANEQDLHGETLQSVIPMTSIESTWKFIPPGKTSLPESPGVSNFIESERILEKLLQLLSFGESRLSALPADRRHQRGSTDRTWSQQETQESWMTLNN